MRFAFNLAFAGSLTLMMMGVGAAQEAARVMNFDRVPLQNEYVTVNRDHVSCGQGERGRCEDRVILAMEDLTVRTTGRSIPLKRGQVAVIGVLESYEAPAQGAFFEIIVKPGHPPVKSPPEIILPPKNLFVFENKEFFIYEERLAMGDVRPRHSHSQRVEIRLSNGPMLHQWVWRGAEVQEIDPGRVNWREPAIHEVRNVGDAELRNFILEFLPANLAR